ncbi:SDR family NAD(P)-dependent oxidoreductase [Blastomonas sp. UPD001]|uniref:SDR family NAD(P)-dependent oxidoreductase n=1 Tax=Blastomonas sp. UPD001 TaxID=2217673 RepID=UPI000E349D89|nr:SDR family NAD(P)-dependent oxidoreductase [Blastomonas sp. UPD001]
MIPADPVWLVTGCSSGFGRALATELATRSIRVVATARSVSALAYLETGPRVAIASLDVTRADTVEGAFDEAVAAFGRVDVVVNNAGIGVIGPVEDVSEEQARLQFEINVFGVLNVVRAALPVLRVQRGGHLVNFASMAGEVSIDSLGIYSASKFAVEGLSEALRAELAPYDVGVTIVEPGPFDTEWLGRNAIWAPRDDARYPAVWEYVEAMRAVYADRAQVGDPARAAAAIVDALTNGTPPERLPLGAMAFDALRRKIAALSATLASIEPDAPSMLYPKETAP